MHILHWFAYIYIINITWSNYIQPYGHLRCWQSSQSCRKWSPKSSEPRPSASTRVQWTTTGSTNGWSLNTGRFDNFDPQPLVTIGWGVWYAHSSFAMDLGYLQGIEHESECRISVRMDGMNSEIWSGEIGFCKNGTGCSSMYKRFQKKGLCNWSQWGIPLSTFMRVCAALLPMLWTLRGVSKSFAWLASRQESGEEGLTCSQQIPANSLHFVAGRFAFSEAPEFCLSIDSSTDGPHGGNGWGHGNSCFPVPPEGEELAEPQVRRWLWWHLVTLEVTLHFQQYTEYHWVHVTWSLQWMQLCVY